MRNNTIFSILFVLVISCSNSTKTQNSTSYMQSQNEISDSNHISNVTKYFSLEKPIDPDSLKNITIGRALSYLDIQISEGYNLTFEVNTTWIIHLRRNLKSYYLFFPSMDMEGKNDVELINDIMDEPLIGVVIQGKDNVILYAYGDFENIDKNVANWPIREVLSTPQDTKTKH